MEEVSSANLLREEKHAEAHSLALRLGVYKARTGSTPLASMVIHLSRAK